MSLVLADVGAAMMLKAIFNNVWPAGGKNLVMKLFCNDYTPLDSSVAGSFAEATGGGYVTKALANGSWTESNVEGIEQVAFAEQTWTFTGALTTNVTIYGYFVVDADGVLVYAERLPAAFTPAVNGDQLKITPVFQMSKGTPT